MLKYLFLILFSSSMALADLTIFPAPSSGEINLDLSGQTINFSNTSATPVSLSFSLSQASSAFSISIDRCSGKTLTQNTSCYIVISVNNSLLSSGVNSADLKNNSSTLLTLKKSKILASGSPALFESTSLSMNDFSARSLVIKNNTLSTQSYSFSLSGSSASKYYIVSNQCQNIASGKSCSVSLKLKPQQAGVYSATLSDSLIGNSVSLSSTITSLTPNVIPSTSASVSASPMSLSFGTLSKFRPSYAQNITITNSGNSIISPIISVSSNMKIVYSRCASLSPAQTCSISVAMNPIYQTSVNGAFNGTVSIKATSESSVVAVSATSTLSVPPALVAYNGEGGSCPSNQHFEGNVCVNNPIGALSCQDIKDANPSATSGYYDLSTGSSGSINVYCDMSDASNAYMEIFDITREPMLTNAQIVARINQFGNFSITESNIVRDSNGSVAWTKDNSNFGSINGQSISFDKLDSSKMKFSVNLGSGGVMGQMILHSSNKTDCIADTNNVSGCYQTAYKYANQYRLIFGDFGTGVPNFNYVLNGISGSYPYPYSVDDLIIDNTPSSIFLTQAGRLEDGTPYPSPFFFFKKLFIKGSFIDPSLLPKPSCAAAKLAGVTSSGVLTLDPDGILGPIQPSKVYCNMSGSGEPTVTENCNFARIFGQKNSANNTGSGSYQIDFDGSGANPAVSQYCDMSQTAWNGNEGGYTLVGVFNSNSAISNSASISDISAQNTYLNNDAYQSLLNKSSHVVFRSNRGNSSEVVFKIQTNIVPLINCNQNSSNILPSPAMAGNSSTSTGNYVYWFWGESDCNVSGADYSLVGLFGNDNYVMFTLSTYISYYIYHYNWGSNSFVLNDGENAAGGGTYTLYPKATNESIYIFLK